MKLARWVGDWIGPALTLVGVVATIWLAVSGRLTLYIHPRYTVFAVALAVVAGMLVLAAIAGGSVTGSDEHGHTHDQPPAGQGRVSRVLTAARVVIVVVAFLGLLVLPPASLTATTQQNRELVTSSVALDRVDTQALVGGDPTTFSVKDWAGLLRLGSDAVLGKPVRVSGYVLDQGDDSVFFVVRMLVNCCAIDAQPLGVPVRRPGWRDEVAANDWIDLSGTFVTNNDARTRFPTVVDPATITKIDKPAQPYVF